MITQNEAKQLINTGWHPLIDQLYTLLPFNVEVLDLKEKFGGLRIDVSGVSEEIEKQVEAIEEKSLTICEECGKPGHLQQSQWSGWIKTYRRIRK